MAAPVFGRRMMGCCRLVLDSGLRARAWVSGAVVLVVGRGWGGAAAVLVVALGSAAPVEGANVRRVLRTAPTLVGLPRLAADGRYQNAADVILESAIRNLPLFPAASSAYTWRWNPETRAFERASD